MINETAPLLDNLEPELVDRMVSRRDAVTDLGKKVGMLAIASAPIMLGAMATSAFGQGTSLPQGIIDILNFALKLEYLENAFYQKGTTTSGAIAPANAAVFAQIAKHETLHVAYLKSALGSAAIALPTFDFTANGAFPDVFTNPATFLALSQGFEDTGVRAYKGQAAGLMSQPAILQVALQVHSVEARHASEVRRIRGQKGWITGASTDVAALAATYAGEDNTTQGGVSLSSITSNTNAATEAFDEPLTMAQVLAIAGQFIKSS